MLCGRPRNAERDALARAGGDPSDLASGALHWSLLSHAYSSWPIAVALGAIAAADVLGGGV